MLSRSTVKVSASTIRNLLKKWKPRSQPGKSDPYISDFFVNSLIILIKILIAYFISDSHRMEQPSVYSVDR